MKAVDTLMWKEIHETPDILNGLDKLNFVRLGALVRSLRAQRPSCVYAVGRGTSDHALMYFKYLIEILVGVPVVLGSCSVVTLYGGKLDLSDALVIGCSQSGKAKDVLAVIERANEQGARTVAITNDPESPLAQAARFSLVCGAGEEKSVAATKTFSAQIQLCAWLAAEWANDEALLQQVIGMGKMLAASIDAIADAARPVADALKTESGGFVLARGVSCAIAYETALKLQETCYLGMKGYPLSDFYHGPMAMVGKGTPILLYAPAHALCGAGQTADNLAGIAKMVGLGGKVFVVTDDPALERIAGATYVTLPATESEIASVAQFALFAQLTACFTSAARVEDPDNPRSLNKVTYTF